MIDIQSQVDCSSVNEVKKAISERESVLSRKRGTLVALKRDGYNPEIKNAKSQLMALQAKLGRFESSQARLQENIARTERDVNRYEAEIDALRLYLPSAKEQRVLKRFLAAGFTNEEMQALMRQWTEDLQHVEKQEKTAG